MALNEALLRESFDLAVEQEGVVMTRFYELLFTRYPQSQALFGKNAPEAQQKMLQDALLAVLDHLDDATWLGETLGNMGIVHISYGVTDEMYPWVGECLIAALAEATGPAWTSAHEAAWAEAYAAVSGLMLAGAERAALTG